MNIIIDSNIPFLNEVLENNSNNIVLPANEITNANLIKYECDTLFIRSTVKANKELLANTNVKYIATATSGTDHFDVEYLKNKNIIYDSALGSNANSVAEYVIFAILQFYSHNYAQIKEKTIGIIGYGCVGKLVAKYAAKIGLKVVLNDPPLKEIEYEFPYEYKYLELNELLKEADIITNHVPLSKHGEFKTLNLISKHRINLIKDGALFIHASRGGVVDEEYLIQNCKSGKIISVVDVWENEPKVNKNNVRYPIISTPHVAGHSFDGKVKGSLILAKNFEKYANFKLNYKKINEIMNQYVPIKDELFSNLHDLFNLLEKSRKINEDSKEFKLIAEMNDDNSIQKFTQMRKNYPIRREIL